MTNTLLSDTEELDYRSIIFPAVLIWCQTYGAMLNNFTFTNVAGVHVLILSHFIIIQRFW